MTGIKVFISSGLSCPNDIKTYSNIGNGLHWKGSGCNLFFYSGIVRLVDVNSISGYIY
jgi:hypothetical protein